RERHRRGRGLGALRTRPHGHALPEHGLADAPRRVLELLRFIRARPPRRMNDRLVGIGGDLAVGMANDTLGIQAAADRLDAVTDGAAKHRDATVRRREVLEPVGADRTLAHLGVVAARRALAPLEGAAAVTGPA